MNDRAPDQAKGLTPEDQELTPEEMLEAMPAEARDTFADLAGVDRSRAERTIQLLGLGSRTLLRELGLVEDVREGGSCRLALTDQAFPVMLAAAMSRCGLTPTVDPGRILSEADQAVACIEARARGDEIKRAREDEMKRAREDEMEPVSLLVRDTIDDSTYKTIVWKIRAAASQLHASPAMAGLLRGVVGRVVPGRQPYAVINMHSNTAEDQVTHFLAYSAKDRSGNALREGEEVSFLPAAAGSGESVAVDVQPLEASTTSSRLSRWKHRV